jgi:8-oxo-dGTP pyrophosphatase MutT (NUDIX family)
MNKIIDKLAWLEIKNRKVLMAKSKGKTKFYIPGGKREANETDAEALIREIKEELSVDIQPETLRFYGIFQAQADSQALGIEVKMQCYFAQYTLNLHPAAEIEDLAWLNYQDYDDLAPVDKLIFTALKEQNLID